MYGDKIAIIGNDISSFIFGISALKEGYTVTVYDYHKNYTPQEFSEFYFPMGEDNTTIREEFEKTVTLKYKEVEYFFNYQNTIYMDKDLINFKKKLIASYPDDTALIVDFCDTIVIAKKAKLYQEKTIRFLSFIEKFKFDRFNKYKNKILKKYGNISIEEYASNFKSQDIKGLITGMLDSRCAMGELFIMLGALYNGTLKHFSIDTYFEDLYNEYISLGGKIEYKFKKATITTRKFKANGLKHYEDKKETPEYIVSAVDPYFTLSNLLNNHIRDAVLSYGYESYPIESHIQLTYKTDEVLKPSVFLETIHNLSIASRPVKHLKYYLDGNKIKCIINQTGAEYEYWAILSQDKSVYKNEIKRIASLIEIEIEKYLHIKAKLYKVITPLDVMGGYKGGMSNLMKVPASIITIKNPGIEGLDNVFLLKWSEGENLDLLTYLMNTRKILEVMKEEKR